MADHNFGYIIVLVILFYTKETSGTVESCKYIGGLIKNYEVLKHCVISLIRLLGES